MRGIAARARRVLEVAAAVVAVAGLAAGPAEAAFPERPVKVVVTDILARTFQKALEEHKLLAQPLTVVNVTGAAGSVGLRQILDSAADGYTVGIWHTGLLPAAAMGVVDFDHRAFTLIARLASTELGFAVAGTSPVPDLATLVAQAKARPEEVKNATNIGLSVHFVPLLFERLSGTRFRYVQTGGGSARLASLLGGHTDFSVFSIAEFIGYGAQLKPIVLFSEKRNAALPDLPTGRELGFDLVYLEDQYLIGPKGLPAEVVATLRTAFEKALDTPDVVKRYQENQYLRTFTPGEATAAEYDRRLEALRPIAQSLKQKP
jgi:tripartite-type tricarboxylate transporter receptor subunit TctC